MRALITGSSGFLGVHLSAAVVEAGEMAFGLASDPSRPSTIPTSHGSILDRDFLDRVLRDSRPTHVFHLAGRLKEDAQDASGMYETNVIGTVRLLEAIHRAGLDPVVIVASSSAVYGRARLLPITEETPLVPVNDYGASKVGQEMVALAFFQSRGMRIVRTRMFNLAGPGQSDRFVTATIAKQIAEAEVSGEGRVVLGNLHARRDYTDVRDAAAAHLALAHAGEPGNVYNVCSGRSVSVKEAASMLISNARCTIELISAPSRGSATEIDEQIGSFSRLRDLVDWKPEITFDVSLRDLLEDWRIRQGKEQQAK